MTARARKTVSTAGQLVPPPEVVRISSDVRDQLITLKRRTGIMNWNVLCRWALCRSLAEPTAPAPVVAGSEGGVEMTWKTFSGAAGDLYWWLVKQRTRDLGLPRDEQSLNAQLRGHIARGTQYLVGDVTLRDTPDLIVLADRG